MKTRILPLFYLSLSGLLLISCSTLKSSQGAKVDINGRWVLLPAINNTETPQAGGRLDSITSSLLYTQGITDLSTYPAANQVSDNVFESADRRTQEDALAWAKKQGAQYAVAGTVEEWRYKVGLDGEPVVGITLSIIDLSSGKKIWTGSGARTGWGREPVSGVAQDLVYALLEEGIHHGK